MKLACLESQHSPEQISYKEGFAKMFKRTQLERPLGGFSSPVHTSERHEAFFLSVLLFQASGRS